MPACKNEAPPSPYTGLQKITGDNFSSSTGSTSTRRLPHGGFVPIHRQRPCSASRDRLRAPLGSITPWTRDSSAHRQRVGPVQPFPPATSKVARRMARSVEPEPEDRTTTSSGDKIGGKTCDFGLRAWSTRDPDRQVLPWPCRRLCNCDSELPHSLEVLCGARDLPLVLTIVAMTRCTLSASRVADDRRQFRAQAAPCSANNRLRGLLAPRILALLGDCRQLRGQPLRLRPTTDSTSAIFSRAIAPCL